ncbi:hypothetical protein SDJN03_12120, partial [Cucurbita argyrosperma subsp. sororia]
MLLIRTVPASLPPWSNLLRRLLFAESRLLQFQRMDSFGSSALPDSSCYGSSCGGNEECLHNRDHNSNVIMIGEIPVNLNRKGNEQESLSRLSVGKCDDFKLRSDQKGIPANIPSSYHDDEFPPVPRQNTKRRSRIDLGSERRLKNSTSSSQMERNEPFSFKKHRSPDIGSKNSLATANLPPIESFDICFPERRGKSKHRYSWQSKDRDTMKVMEHADEATNGIVMRPGMVLLKHYIPLHEQVNIVKTIQKLGLGPGGFYQPGYKDGAKLRLQMMCLGLDWDPQTRKYARKRVADGNKPPDLPPEFAILVGKALNDAHALIKNNGDTNNIEDILPTMSPDICIVNFYSTSGRLGLHQDRDESRESLVGGLPVVSFSLGNSAEFLYGDQRDVDKAGKIILESGDVLIFGGESRHIFHGVSSIIPKSTPKFLLDHTGLRPGRLNLTFRKY